MNKIAKKIKKFFRKRYARFASLGQFSAYLAGTKVAKLHLGCGVRMFEGWLNTDFYADPGRGVVFQDLSKPFPCADRRFDFILSEHVQEHFSLKDGERILSECFRALKDGGVLRLATPDIDFYIRLYLNRERLSEAEKNFLHYFLSTFEDVRGFPNDPMSAVNGVFYGFGHQFIYSFDCIAGILKRIGFREVTRVTPGESRYEPLRGLETNAAYRQDASGADGLSYHLMANLSLEAIK